MKRAAWPLTVLALFGIGLRPARADFYVTDSPAPAVYGLGDVQRVASYPYSSLDDGYIFPQAPSMSYFTYFPNGWTPSSSLRLEISGFDTDYINFGLPFVAEVSYDQALSGFHVYVPGGVQTSGDTVTIGGFRDYFPDSSSTVKSLPIYLTIPTYPVTDYGLGTMQVYDGDQLVSSYQVLVPTVPEPSSLVLLATGAIAGLGYIRWQRRKRPLPA